MIPVVYSLTQTLYFVRSKDIYYIFFSDYRDYRAKVSTSADKFCQLFYMHPISLSLNW